MGCVLLAPLVNEAVKKEKSLDHCQAAITHLTRVSAWVGRVILKMYSSTLNNYVSKNIVSNELFVSQY